MDPAISAARKAAANARWRKAAADAVPAAARDDRQYVDHLHRKLLATRSKGADLLADAQPEIVRIGERSYNIAIAGIGGTGILTISAILGMAAHLDGKSPMILDMAGLAQKGGAVMSHLRIGLSDQDVSSPDAAGAVELNRPAVRRQVGLFHPVYRGVESLHDPLVH